MLYNWQTSMRGKNKASKHKDVDGYSKASKRRKANRRRGAGKR